MARIFINYRRDDSAPYAGRLYDHLSAHFGSDQIFMDIDTMKPGVDFVEVIEQSVGNCDAFIVVIGRQWLSITDEKGNRRLDNPNDYVRLEVATALHRNILVIPVLVDRASMPRADELPADLGKLARRNALEISNERFGYDVKLLIDTLDEAFPVTPASPRQPAPHPQKTASRTRIGLLALVLIVLLLGLVLAKVVQQGPATPTLAIDNVTFSVQTDAPTPQDTPDTEGAIRAAIDKGLDALNAGASSRDFTEYLDLWDQQSTCYASISVPNLGTLSVPDYVQTVFIPGTHVTSGDIKMNSYDQTSASVDVEVFTTFPNQPTQGSTIRLALENQDGTWKATCICWVGATCS